MELQKLNCEFTVCKINHIGIVDFSREYVFLSKTSDEISLVCESDYTPSDTISAEPGWKALKISGELDFGMVGVISRISSILADAKISIFVISTYNTDYILLKSEVFDGAVAVLLQNGYVLK